MKLDKKYYRESLDTYKTIVNFCLQDMERFFRLRHAGIEGFDFETCRKLFQTNKRTYKRCLIKLHKKSCEYLAQYKTL